MLRQLAVYRFPLLEVRVDGERCDTSTLIVARGRLYGGRFVLAPEADQAVPQLHAALFLRSGAPAMAACLTALAFGRLERSAMVRIVPAQRVEVAGPPGDPVQGDGDILAGLPAVIGLTEQEVHLAVPAHYPAPALA
ncbi:diacylglycerol/lipid kinase family protein [Marinibaculum pumilum]|uniref:Diacylglycerol/lipid kinase family protein n=1 Tax=Marinibaculum pumilum TaxID=1766165 RepID=A0ABV7L8I8_9PROT